MRLSAELSGPTQAHGVPKITFSKSRTLVAVVLYVWISFTRTFCNKISRSPIFFQEKQFSYFLRMVHIAFCHTDVSYVLVIGLRPNGSCLQCVCLTLAVSEWISVDCVSVWPDRNVYRILA